MTVGSLGCSADLIRAVYHKDYDQCLLLVNAKSVNYQDEHKQSALHIASHCGDTRIVELLLTEGAVVTLRDGQWLTALHRACASGSSDVVKLLLEHGADRNSPDKNWLTPLHVSAARGSLDCARLLFAPSNCIVNVDASDRLGRTPLHHAVWSDHIDMARLLLESGASVNAIDDCDRRAIHWAAACGSCEMIELLSSFGADLNCQDQDQFTPLHVAAALGHTASAKCLITLGADVNCVTKRGNTPLHISCLNGFDDVAQVLLEAISKEASTQTGSATEQTENTTTPAEQDLLALQVVSSAIHKLSDGDQLTPLHLAVTSTNGMACLRLLLEALAQPDKQSFSSPPVLTVPGGLDHSYPLHLAALHGRLDSLDLLSQYNIPLDVRDRSGDTALHIASARGYDVIVRNLLRGGCRWDLPGRQGFSALHCAAMSGFLDCLYRIIVAALPSETKSDEILAYFSGECEVHPPLDLSVMTKLTANLGRSAEFYTRMNELVELTDKHGRTLVHASALNGNVDCLKFVLLAGADPFRIDSGGWTPLHYTVASCAFAICSPYCRDSAPADSSHGDKTSSHTDPPWTYRLNAIDQANVCSLVFLKLGINVNLADRHGCTALHLACAFDTKGQLVDQLVDYGADIFARTSWPPVQRDVYGNKEKSVLNEPRFSPLHIAVNCSNVPAVKSLLSACPVNLLSAYTTGTLTDCDASVGTCDSLSNQPPSPFLLAAIRGHEEIMQLLLDAWLCTDNTGSPSDCCNQPGKLCDSSGRTALHFAAFGGNLAICRILLEHADRIGTSVYDKDSVYRWNALHHAASQGHVDVVKLLVVREISACTSTDSHPPPVGIEKFVDDVDEHGRTALMLASQNNHTGVIHLLLGLCKGSAINATDAYGRTALHRAVANGHEFCAELLLQSGADPTIADFRNRQAVHMAATGGRVNTLALTLRHLIQLANDRGDVSNSYRIRDLFCPLDQHGFTPLHFAAYGGHTECVRVLFNGTGYERMRGNTYTPMHCAAQHGHLDCLKLLLSRYGTSGATIRDSKGRTALHIAALMGHVDCLNELLLFVEHKTARVHAPVVTDSLDQHLSFASFVLQRDSNEHTALMLAATTGARRCVECLLDVHIRLNTELLQIRNSDHTDKDLITSLTEASSMGATDKDLRTVLHLACTASLDDAAMVVLDRIDDTGIITQPDRLQRTPLHLAIASGLANVTEALISRGADLYAVDSDGCIPVFAAAPSLRAATCLSLGLAAMFPPIGETVADNPFVRTTNTLTPKRSHPGSVNPNVPVVLNTQTVNSCLLPTSSPSLARTSSYPNPDGDFF